MKRLLKAIGIDTRRLTHAVLAFSIERAVREQKLGDLRDRLRAIVPDLTDQFSQGFDRREYDRFWERKLRGVHAFQVARMLEAIGGIAERPISVADIGDSSGNHAAYLRGILPDGSLARVLSVNLDPVAVQKIRAKGGEAVQARAEELCLASNRFDLVVVFEMLEHLTDPTIFLRRLAEAGVAEKLLITVPFVRSSRMGLDFIRNPGDMRVSAEAVHVFELSPGDWTLLCRFAGWEATSHAIYFQYPRRALGRILAPLWRRLDYEGFLALSLRRDMTVSNRYLSWPTRA